MQPAGTQHHCAPAWQPTATPRTICTRLPSPEQYRPSVTQKDEGQSASSRTTLRPLRLSRITESRLAYGLTFEIRVYQFPSVVRVPPQLPNGAAMYCVMLPFCPMYSDAIPISAPSATAAP